MAADEKWYFTKEQLANTPSRKCGYELDKELSYRQQAANFIQDMGQRLQVTQLCINTAIVYMHRFYVFHSFTQFHRNAMAAAALFLAAKVEEQPRKLEHVIRVAHMCLNRDQPPLDTKSEKYLEHAQDLVFNENVLLQTLGFDVAIDHPHTHVVRCCHLVRASKDLAQTSYFMASNSLHLTTMCLQYKPTVVACFCIHLACKWSNWEIPQSNEGKDWFWYVDKTVTLELLEQLTAEFLVIFDKCPTKLKRKIMSISAAPNPSLPPTISGSPFDMEPRKIRPPDGANSQGQDGLFHTAPPGSSRPPQHHPNHPGGEQMKPPDKGVGVSQSSINSQQPPQRVDYREYKEKKERERLAQQQQSGSVRDGHHSVGHPGMHSNKSMPSSNNKHAAMMPASNSSMMGKPVPPPHHRDHKHPPPMGQSSVRPTNNAVSQSRDALRREQAYARDASKREAALAQRGGEYIFAPPYRHQEAKEPALPTIGDMQPGHHALSSESNHLSNSVNSGSRKDNQEWTGGETVNEVSSDVTNKHDKTNALINRASDMKERAENRHSVNLHHDPNLKRSQQPIYEHSNKHSNRVPSEHRTSSGMTAVDGRSSKEANLPPQKPSSDVSERQTYNHSKHSGASGSVNNERMDHSRHRRTGTSEPYHSRPPSSHSVADVPVEHKANLPEFERKSNVMDLADRKPNVEAIDRKPAIADLPERKPDYQYLGVSDVKHEGSSSSSRRPGNSVLSYHQATVKREPKVESSSVVKKEESSDGRGVSSSLRPPPQQQQVANVAVPSHRSRTRSPSQQPGHDRSPSLPRSRSPAVPTQPKSPQLRSKSPNVVSVSNSSSVKRSESPHHTRTKGHSNRNDSTITQTNEEQVPEARSKRSEATNAKVETAAMTIKTEVDSSVQVPQATKSSSSSSQKASLSVTPDKSTGSSSRESPYPRSSKSTRQRTPPSSGSKKQSTPAPTPESALSPLSPFGSPPPPTSVTPGKSNLRATSRHRTSSSSSEPELVPVVKKLDEIAGYENIIRDSKMGIKLPGRVPDIIPPIRDRSKKDEAGMLADGSGRNNTTNQSVSVAKELKPPDLIQPFSAQVTDQVSDSSKPLSLEAELDSDPTEIAFPPTTVLQPTLEPDVQNAGLIDLSAVDESAQNALPAILPEGTKAPATPEAKRPSEHHHKSEKKKKKKEHKEHKHKDKDKNREEKKHRHKHKDKDKDRHKEKTEPASAPIKITIPKDKINLSSTLEPASGSGLKLKIQKDRLKGTDSTGSSPQSTPIKIKISKEMINFNNSSTASSNQAVTVTETTPTASTRKRDRSSPRSSELVSPPGPPAKSARLTASEQRSRSSYGKQNGVEHHRSSRGSSSHYTAPVGASGNKVRGRGRGNRGGRYSTPPPNHPMAHVPREAYQAYPMPPYYTQPYGHPANMVPTQHYLYEQMYGYYPTPQPPFAMYQQPPPMPPGPPPPPGENTAPPLPEGPPPLPEGPPPEDIPPPPPPPE